MTKYREMEFPKLAIKFKDIRVFDRDLVKELGLQEQQLRYILDRGLSVADNWDAREVSFTSNATPDAEDTVAHTLGKVPTGYFVVSRDKAAILYDGTSSWTATNIYLKSNVASTAYKILVY